jgi:hypothetical protein
MSFDAIAGNASRPDPPFWSLAAHDHPLAAARYEVVTRTALWENLN